MLENVLQKTTDPANRCQSLMAGGSRQCMYEKVPGGNNCVIHGGHHRLKKIEQAKVRNYNLFRYQQRVNEFADSEGVKSLREEIGILRLLLENIVNQCHDEHDLLMYTPKIAELATKIQSIVASAHKLESSLGFMMDRQQILSISHQMVNVISIYVEDEEVINKIMDHFIDLLTTEQKELTDERDE